MSEKNARIIIIFISAAVLGLVTFMYLFPGFQVVFKENFPEFNIYVLPKINAILNTVVTILLLAGLYFVKNRQIVNHKKVMLAATFVSSLFLIVYVFYHLIAPKTMFGGEGFVRAVYFFILVTHVVLAAVSFPFILLTMYRGLVGQYALHQSLAKIVFPVWLYVAITGVVVYLMISPYYGV
jgi:putative membrane protein